MKKQPKGSMDWEQAPPSALQFTKRELIYFAEELEQVTYTMNEYMLLAGETENYLYFIVEGFVKAVKTRNNKSICFDFGVGGTMFCSFTSFVTRQPSQLSIQTLSKVVAYRVHYDQVYTPLLPRQHQQFIQKMTEAFYLERFNQDAMLVGFDAQERYQSLLEGKPLWSKQIPIKDLATYLGIHPESLSRLRRKIYQEDK